MSIENIWQDHESGNMLPSRGRKVAYLDNKKIHFCILYELYNIQNMYPKQILQHLWFNKSSVYLIVEKVNIDLFEILTISKKMNDLFNMVRNIFEKMNFLYNRHVFIVYIIKKSFVWFISYIILCREIGTIHISSVLKLVIEIFLPCFFFVCMIKTNLDKLVVRKLGYSREYRFKFLLNSF